MTTVPGPLYVAGDRWPVVTWLFVVASLAAIGSALGGALSPSLLPPLAIMLLLVVPVAAPLEDTGGSLVILLAIVLAAAAGYGVPLALDQRPPAIELWLIYGAMTFLALALASFQALKPRPFCFISGLSRLSLHWSVLFMLWLLVEAWVGWHYGLPALVHTVVVFALGLLLGLGVRAAGLVKLVSSGSIEELRSGIHAAQKLMDQHNLPAARRHIDALLVLAPHDLAVRRMRYAAWKFDPQQPAFHRSAADLLARREIDGGDQADITALYKDYLAVTQGRPQLPTELHLTLAQRFADWNDTDNAANIVNLYLSRETDHPSLPEALLRLADAYYRTDRPSRAEYFADTLIGLLPTSGEAQMAQRLLRKIRQGER